MSSLNSLPSTLQSRRRLAVIGAVLTCAFAVLMALTTVDANAAAVQGAPPRTDAPGATPRASTYAIWNNTDVYFRNNHGTPVSVAIMRYNPDQCGGEGLNYQTRGWYNLAPGEVKLVFSTTARYGYYYAKASDGATWSGHHGNVYLYRSAFNSCLGLGSTAAYTTVGMLPIDTSGTSRFTINLN